MKYVLVLVVVLVAAWVLMGRNRGRGDKAKPGAATGGARSAGAAGAHKAAAAGTAQAMVACAHCALHLPQTEAVADPQGRWFCGEAHRLAGPAQPPPG